MPNETSQLSEPSDSDVGIKDVVSEFMTQVDEFPSSGWTGCKGTDVFWGADLAKEAWGENADLPGVNAFPYLWRRFGPPFRGSDPHKSLADYCLTTNDPDVVTWITVSASSLYLGVGALWSAALEELIRGPRMQWETDFEQWWIDNEHPEIIEWEDTPDNAERASSIYWDDRKAGRESGMYDRAESEIGKMPQTPHHDQWRNDDGPVHRINTAVFESLCELKRPVFIRDVPINVFGKTECHEDAVEQSVYAGLGCDKDALDLLLSESH